MDVKDAVAAAKAYVRDLYDESERVAELSLEEVEFDAPGEQWLVTVEFSRPAREGFRSRAREILDATGGHFMPRRRVQKVVVVSDARGVAVAMRNREAA